MLEAVTVVLREFDVDAVPVGEVVEVRLDVDEAVTVRDGWDEDVLVDDVVSD